MRVARPEPTSRPDTQQAVDYAAWWLNVALDRIGHDGRHYDPSLHVRLVMAQAQLSPAVELAKPAHDQVVIGAET